MVQHDYDDDSDHHDDSYHYDDDDGDDYDDDDYDDDDDDDDYDDDDDDDDDDENSEFSFVLCSANLGVMQGLVRLAPLTIPDALWLPTGVPRVWHHNIPFGAGARHSSKTQFKFQVQDVQDVQDALKIQHKPSGMKHGIDSFSFFVDKLQLQELMFLHSSAAKILGYHMIPWDTLWPSAMDVESEPRMGLLCQQINHICWGHWYGLDSFDGVPQQKPWIGAISAHPPHKVLPLTEPWLQQFGSSVLQDGTVQTTNYWPYHLATWQASIWTTNSHMLLRFRPFPIPSLSDLFLDSNMIRRKNARVILRVTGTCI